LINLYEELQSRLAKQAFQVDQTNDIRYYDDKLKDKVELQSRLEKQAFQVADYFDRNDDPRWLQSRLEKQAFQATQHFDRNRLHRNGYNPA